MSARPRGQSVQAQPEEDVEPVVMPSPSLWRLDSEPDFVADAGRTWQRLAGFVAEADTAVGDAAGTLLAGWTGEAARAYQHHHGELAKALTTVSTTADALGAVVTDAADTLRRAQADLDASWRALQTGPRTWAAIREATTEAQYIRLRARARLDALTADVHELRSRLWVHEVLGSMLEPEVELWASSAPELAAGGRVIVDGQRVIVTGSGTGDTIEVGNLPSTGQQYVTVNGVRQYFPADAQIIVRAGGGSDTIRLVSPSGSGAPAVTVLGGQGGDTIHGSGNADTLLGLWGQDEIFGYGADDIVYGGSDDDYLSGGAGDDVLYGGAGRDTVYGLDGQDRILGGHDTDVVDGGADHDVIYGGRGDDTLFGGNGLDMLVGDAGNDALFVGDDDGSGSDRSQFADGGTGADTARVDDDDWAYAESVTVAEAAPRGDAVVVDSSASAEFRARVESDLDALRSTDSGAAMLAALQQSHDAHGDTVIIAETDGSPGETGSPRDGVPVGARIHYNPTFTPVVPGGLPAPPLVVLYHEMAHAYQDFYDGAATGTYGGVDDPDAPNSERQAVGLPIEGDNDHPYPLTENGLRAELGLPPRPAY